MMTKQRHLMNKRFEPTIYQHECTPDGFCEVTIEVNGRIIATTIGGPQVNASLAIEYLVSQMKSHC